MEAPEVPTAPPAKKQKKEEPDTTMKVVLAMQAQMNEFSEKTSRFQGQLSRLQDELSQLLVPNPKLYNKLNTNRHLAAIALMEFGYDRLSFFMRRELARELLGDAQAEARTQASDWFGQGKVFWQGDIADVSWRSSVSWCMRACMQSDSVEVLARASKARGLKRGTKNVDLLITRPGSRVPLVTVSATLGSTVQQLRDALGGIVSDSELLVSRSRILDKGEKLSKYKFLEAKETIFVAPGMFTVEEYWRSLGYIGPLLSGSWLNARETQAPVSMSLKELVKSAATYFGVELDLSWEQVHMFFGVHFTTLVEDRNSEVHLFGLHQWQRGSKSRGGEVEMDSRRENQLRSFERNPLNTGFTLMELKMKLEVLDDLSNNLEHLHLFYRVFRDEFLLLVKLARATIAQIVAIAVSRTLNLVFPVHFRAGISLERWSDGSFTWIPIDGYQNLLRAIENDEDIASEPGEPPWRSRDLNICCEFKACDRTLELLVLPNLIHLNFVTPTSK